MNKSDFKTLGICVVAFTGSVTVQCMLANSSIGFSVVDLSKASSGIRALMVVMMDWKSIFYVGVPGGIIGFCLGKMLRLFGEHVVTK